MFWFGAGRRGRPSLHLISSILGWSLGSSQALSFFVCGGGCVSRVRGSLELLS